MKKDYSTRRWFNIGDLVALQNGELVPVTGKWVHNEFIPTDPTLRVLGYVYSMGLANDEEGFTATVWGPLAETGELVTSN